MCGFCKKEEAKSSCKCFTWIIIAVAAVVAVGACVASYFCVKKKREKEQKELEEYLDYSIL